MTCKQCGKQVKKEELVRTIDGDYCDGECYKKHLHEICGNQPIGSTTLFEIPKPKDRKHEEIKRMAWELYVRLMFGVAPPDIESLHQSLKQAAFQKTAWEEAEHFYNFAKEKEENEDA